MPTTLTPTLWTTSDLELFPDDDKRYEIIAGELLVTRAPHWRHQKLCTRLGGALDAWSIATGLGEAVINPGVIFSETDAVIPDLVWVAQGRLGDILDESGHLTAAPDLVVEVLSGGKADQRRDRELKLKLYGSRGVREYWIVDPQIPQVEAYRRDDRATLVRTMTLFAEDTLTSPLLPDFSYGLIKLFG